MKLRRITSLCLIATVLLVISIAFATRPQAANQPKIPNRNHQSEISTSPGAVAVNSSSSGFTAAKTVSPTLQVANGKIFFNSDRDGNSEIYVMNADGTGQTRLTNNPAVDADPAWSAANQKVVFVSNRSGWFQIYTMNADGSSQTQLTTNSTNDGSPAWSPNGSEIVFAREVAGNLHIFRMNADGSSQTQLTVGFPPNINPSWSPAGSRIIFESKRDGHSDIYTMSRVGDAETRLTTNPADDQFPDWSPEGTRIAFASTRDVNQEIYVMNVDGSNQTRLTDNLGSDGLPVWSPDGNKIVFESNRDGNFQIYTMNSDGSNQTRLTLNSSTDGNPTWAQGSTPIATSVWTDTGSLNAIRISATATLLNNGKVLLAGGLHNGSIHASSELYDPVSGTWTLTGSLQRARHKHAAILLPDGKVLVVGGFGPGGETSAELYDPVSGMWNLTGDLHETKTKSGYVPPPAVVLLPNGKVLAAGGGSAELYDPTMGTWIITGRPSTQGNVATLLPNGKVLLVTGGPLGVGGTAELYDPVSGSWSLTGGMNSYDHVREPTLTLLANGKVLGVGGRTGPGSDGELYDPSSGTWAYTDYLGTRRWEAHTATRLASGEVLVVGGLDPSGKLITSSDLYDPVAGRWRQAASPTRPRAYHTSTLLPNGKVLVAGGTDAIAELYDGRTISGRVMAGMSGVGNVTMTLSGHMSSTTITDEFGNYSFNVPPGGDYTVTPSRMNFSFAPTSLSFSNLVVSQTAANFAATQVAFKITGVLFFSNGIPLSGIDVTISGSRSAVVQPVNNMYTFDGLQPGGNYTVTPSPPAGFKFVPASRVFNNLASDQRADFERLPVYTVSGRVADSRGIGVANVNILLGIQFNPPIPLLTTTTDSNGNYRLEFDPNDIHGAYNQTSAVYPSKAGYSFSPILFRTVAGVDVFGTSIGVFQRNTPKTVVANFTAQRIPPATAWIATGAMVTQRHQHTATLLANGKVLVAGGNDGSGHILASAELYDPATGKWTPTGAMSIARQYHTATLLPNGKVMVAGTNISQGVSASAEIYDPATGQWTPTGSMNVARSVHTETLLPNGKVLVAGGISNAGRYLNSAELYDPATGLWTLTGAMTAMRYAHTATLLGNGKVLVAGGFAVTGQALIGAELYDPATGTWTQTGSFTNARYLHTATLLSDGKVVIAGGINTGSGPSINTTELYDPANGTWTVTGTLNTARHQHTGTLLPNGEVLIAGGGVGTASVELNDPPAGIWDPAPSMLTARSAHTATLLPNQKVLVAGGINNSGGGTLASAELYDNTPGWESNALTSGQVEIKTWTVNGRTYAHVKPLFPNAGYRVTNWGQPARSGNDFTADAAVEQFSGASVQAVTTTAQIYDLGPLADGTYNFNFNTSGTLAKSLQFTVSSAASPPNPIDDARQFVKQQYRDFLNREADQAGEDFWTDNITKCMDPARRPPGQTVEQCTLRQRDTTSGAFFLSPEFQYTGYFVYRMYKGALGRPPKLSEFTQDAMTVGNGIIVNGQLSAAKINQNKAAFTATFVNCVDATKSPCAEFKSIYDGLNNQLYVDKLFQTTGVNRTTAEWVALVNGLNSNPATETRASVLQKVVDGINVISEGNQQFTTTYGQAFYNAELNRAFVQLEYFGYMRRDPDEAGYAFWLGKLNQFGGDFVAAEMVLAFISSPEYRARFGQP